jgi:hypothetical protein
MDRIGNSIGTECTFMVARGLGEKRKELIINGYCFYLQGNENIWN